MKKMIKLILVVFGFLLIIMAIFFIAAMLSGKGEIEPFYDENGNILENSIAEKVFVDINGRENGMIIRGKNIDNPVVLFISGGPGVPEYWLNVSYEKQYPNRLEEEFTVCWWDYMGEGLSYDEDISPKDITIEKLAADAVEVTQYLQERFGQEKIYLMAHSGGTPLGLYLAQNNPEQFYCYFSMGQVVNEGNCRYEAGYYYLKDYFDETGNKRALRKLDKLIQEENGELTILNEEKIGMEWESLLLMAEAATFREMKSDAFGIFFPQMFSSCYTFSEKIDYWRGKMLLAKSPYAAYTVSLTDEQPAKIPIYFMSGYYDYTTPVSLVEELYENLEAPDKAFYLFENSAHSPLWEENDEVMEVMRKYVR